MVYRRAQVRKAPDGSVTSIFRGREAGSTLVVAVVEHLGMLTVFDNGDDGSRVFPDRMLRTGDRESIVPYLRRFGIGKCAARRTPPIIGGHWHESFHENKKHCG